MAGLFVVKSIVLSRHDFSAWWDCEEACSPICRNCCQYILIKTPAFHLQQEPHLAGHTHHPQYDGFGEEPSIVLHCTALYFIILHCTELYFVLLHWNEFYLSVLQFTALQYCAVYCSKGQNIVALCSNNISRMKYLVLSLLVIAADRSKFNRPSIGWNFLNTVYNH